MKNKSPNFVTAMKISTIFIAVFLFGVQYTNAAVMFNEVAWMGTEVSANDEWIELYNDSDAIVDLVNWRIVAEDGQPDIVLEGIILGKSYTLLERSDDETIPGIIADTIYSGSLGNGGEYLELRNELGNVQDIINALDGWAAGDNITKETMQWTGSAWITGPGTPRAGNVGVEVVVDEDEEDDEPVATTNPETVSGSGSTPYTPPEFRPRLQVDAGEDINTVVGSEVRLRARAIDWEGAEIDYRQVRFVWNFGDGTIGDGRNVNHFYAYPGTYVARVELFSGHDIRADIVTVVVGRSPLVISEVLVGENGWIELFNDSSAILDVGRWILQSGKERFIFPTGTIIAPYARPVLTNVQSGLRLLDNRNLELILPNMKILDSFSLVVLDEHISTIREAESFYTGEPTPGEENIVHSSSIFSSPETMSQVPTSQTVYTKPLVVAGGDFVEAELKKEEAATTTNKQNKNTQASVLDNSLTKGSPVVWFVGSFVGALLVGFLTLFIRKKYYIS